jgi:predicted secreted protein
MTTAAKAAFGTTFQWNSQTVAELTNIGGYELSIDMIDVTNHQSTSGFKEQIAGLVDVGEIPIEGNFKYSDSNGQIAMATDAAARTSRTITITFPSSLGVLTGTAFITKLKIGDAPHDGKIPFSASLKITGAPTFTVTAGEDLTGLTVTTGTLVPVFGGTTYAYVVNIATDQATCTVTPTCAAADSITVNGNVVASGSPSSAITLGAAGSVTTIHVITIDAGKTNKDYTLYLTRAAAE